MLSGCDAAGGPDIAQTVKPGTPLGFEGTDGFGELSAVWLTRGESFALVTWGSGSCPPVASALTAEAADRITVVFEPSPHDPCTADMSPTTHEFAVPDEATRTPLTIDVAFTDWPDAHTLVLD